MKIKLTSQAEQAVAEMKAMPEKLFPAIARGMNLANQQTVALIQRKYLSFSKSGPTVANGLRVQSGDYRRSLYASPAQIIGEQVASAIGSPVNKNGFSYPALHEFGGTVHRPAGKVKLKVDNRGSLVGQSFNQNLAVFARRNTKRFREVSFAAHDAEYPARAPIQHGIQDSAANYTKFISAEVVKAWKS